MMKRLRFNKFATGPNIEPAKGMISQASLTQEWIGNGSTPTRRI